jgi:hypothetical protein
MFYQKAPALAGAFLSLKFIGKGLFNNSFDGIDCYYFQTQSLGFYKFSCGYFRWDNL